ncbi:MAG: hypothetical protein ACXACI_11450 [Candidatus Hodarchaeales archaeon]|jgi:hypothetical protein
MSEDSCHEIEKHEETLKSLLKKMQSGYSRLTNAAEEQEMLDAYQEGNDLLQELSNFDFGIVQDLSISENSSCAEIIQKIEKQEKAARDLRLKMKLRLSIISKDLSKIEEARLLRLEDLKEEMKAKIEHLGFQNAYQEIEEYEKALKSLLKKAFSSYSRLTNAVEEQEMIDAYQEGDDLLQRLSSIEYSTVQGLDISGNTSSAELLQKIDKHEKTTQDLRLKMKLRLSIISKDLSKIEETRLLRLEDLKEEMKIKLEHLNYLEKDINRIYNILSRSIALEELATAQSQLKENMMLLQGDDSEELHIEDAKVLSRERETLFALANYLEGKIETKIRLLKDLELIGAENLSNRIRPKLESTYLEIQKITQVLSEAGENPPSADYLQRAEWYVEGIEIEDYMNIPQLHDQLRDYIEAISQQISQIRAFIGGRV